MNKLHIDRWQIVGDVVMLLAFILIGEQDHGMLDDPAIVWTVLRAVIVFGLPWLGAAWWCGALARVSRQGFWRWVAATVQALLIALPLGIWLRALWLDRAVVPTLFISATLGFGTLFILGWRLVYGIWRVRAAGRLEPAGVEPMSASR